MAFTLKDGVLVALAAVSIYLLIDKFTGEPITDNACACDDRKRITKEMDGGGQGLTADVARPMVGAFVERYFRDETDPIRGGFISKHALDQIFCNDQEADGIFYYYALKDGKNSLIIEPGRTDYCKLRCSENDVIFVSETTCPNICASF